MNPDLDAMLEEAWDKVQSLPAATPANVGSQCNIESSVNAIRNAPQKIMLNL